MKKETATVKDLLKGGAALFIMVSVILWGVKTFLNIVALAVSKIAQITSNMDAVIIVALITGGVSIIGVIFSSIVAKVLEYRQETNRYLYEKREEPYSQFIEMVYKLQQMSKNGDQYSEKEMMADIVQFSKKLTLWGSNSVIKQWLQFRENSQDPASAADNLFVLENIIFEIRKDMGQKKGKLEQGDLLAFFINDIKQYTKK